MTCHICIYASPSFFIYLNLYNRFIPLTSIFILTAVHLELFLTNNDNTRVEIRAELIATF